MTGDEHSFRELDEVRGLPKGSAFRAFKRVAGQLEEGHHFRVLEAHRDHGEIEALRQAGRIYDASVNVVLLGPGAAARVAAELDGRQKPGSEP